MKQHRSKIYSVTPWCTYWWVKETLPTWTVGGQVSMNVMVELS